jgi:hypothetical protein
MCWRILASVAENVRSGNMNRSASWINQELKTRVDSLIMGSSTEL